MRGLAARLGIEVDEGAWPELVGAASFSGCAPVQSRSCPIATGS